MNYKDKITEICCEVDDFCKEFSAEIAKLKLAQLSSDKKHRNRAGKLSDSEIITIMIGFHFGAHRTFKNYYLQVVCQQPDLFPQLVSYSRFVRLQ